METTLVKCRVCGEEKPLSQYRKASCMANGHRSECKTCNRIYYDQRKASYPLRSVWSSMKYRCSNTKSNSFKDYGARGIQVCNEWRDDYHAFQTWAFANGYRQGLEIDRVDNEGGYAPSNCRFVTRTKNAQNKRLNQKAHMWNRQVRLLQCLDLQQRDMANIIGVSQRTVNLIVNKKHWTCNV